jgi:gamma-glutamyltranspeptidase/glutathione hydrolase
MGSPAVARTAMVSTSSPLAVQAALEIWRKGGSAVDAAIASDAVLGVVQPFWTGIGGDLFCLVDDGREVVGFNGSGAAPSELTLTACQQARAEQPVAPELAAFIDGLPDRSPLAVTVPGAVDGWCQLSARYGRLPLAHVLEPARELAASGYPLGPRAAEAWQAAAHRLHPPVAPGLGGVVAAGHRRTNPELAASLDAIGRAGRAGHYEGPWAAGAVASVRDAGGALRPEDLANHRGEWVQPLCGEYRGHEVVQLPPNGVGAAVLAGLRRLARSDAPGLAEVMLAARDGMELASRYVADPRHVSVEEFWTGDTVYTAVAAGGMAVSLISSVFWAFGSGLSAGGAVLQNRGCGFALEAGHPNAAAGGKRPAHTIIPALLRKGGRTTAVLGVVGGPMQPQGQLQVISALLDRGADAQSALDAPRARWLARDLVAVEAGVDELDVTRLREAGFRVLTGPLDPAEAGAGQLIRVHADGWLEGGADARRDGTAFGW